LTKAQCRINNQSLKFEANESFARKMDEADSLARFREKFYMPKQPGGADAIYLTGNSLGLQPKTTRDYIEQELKDWETLGVEGHFKAKNPWMPYHERLTEQIGKANRRKTNRDGRDEFA
jgi:kynureninase